MSPRSRLVIRKFTTKRFYFAFLLNLGAIILRDRDRRALYIVDSKLRRSTQRKINLSPGIYQIVPYTSGSHFLVNVSLHRSVKKNLEDRDSKLWCCQRFIASPDLFGFKIKFIVFYYAMMLAMLCSAVAMLCYSVLCCAAVLC